MIKVAVEVVRKSKIGITYFFAEDRDAPGASSATSGSDPRLSPPTPGAVMPGEADLKCLSGAAEQGVAFALFGGCVPATAVPLFRRDQAQRCWSPLISRR
jgi:hypothetical protein